MAEEDNLACQIQKRAVYARVVSDCFTSGYLLGRYFSLDFGEFAQFISGLFQIGTEGGSESSRIEIADKRKQFTHFFICLNTLGEETLSF